MRSCTSLNNTCPKGWTNAKCVVYTGPNLPNIGAITNNNLEEILILINDMFGGGGIVFDDTATIDLVTTGGLPTITANLIVGEEDPLEGSYLMWDGTNVIRRGVLSMETWISDWRKNNYQLSAAVNATYRDENKQTVTLASGQNELHALVYYGDRLWAIDTSFPMRLYRFNNPDDLTDYDVIDIGNNADETGLDLVYVPWKRKLYTGVYDTNATGNTYIYEVDPVTLAKTLIITYTDAASLYFGPSAFAYDEEYLYVLEANGTILKVDLSDYSYSTTTLSPAASNAHGMKYDGTYLYVTDVNTHRIWQINPTTLAVVQSTDFGASGITDDFCFAGDYLWCGIENVSGEIRVIHKTAFTATTITTGIAAACYGTFFDGKYVWAFFNTTPGQLLRIDPETREIYKHILDTGENRPNEMATDGQRYFVTCFTSPAKIIRFSCPTLLQFVSSQAGGSVTSIASGNGMNFSTITTTGTVTMGTPSSITLASTNSLTATSHTHAFVPGGTSGEYIRGDGTVATFPSTISGITADNGITATSSTNVQLGSTTTSGVPLLHDTFINTDGDFILNVVGTRNSFAPIFNVLNSGTGIAGWFTSGGTSNAALLANNTSSGPAIFAFSDNGGRVLNGIVTSSNTNGILEAIQINRNTTGSAASGIGASIVFNVENSGGGMAESTHLVSKFITVTPSAEVSQFIIQCRDAATTKDVIYFEGDKRTRFNGRAQFASGANVVSANDLTLGADGNVFVITGNTQVNAITSTNWQSGSVVFLLFNGAAKTVKHNTAGGAGTSPMLLAGSVDLVTDNNTVLTLVFNGTEWEEIGRKLSASVGNYVFSNGITESPVSTVKLGGTLVDATTTITAGNNVFIGTSSTYTTGGIASAFTFSNTLNTGALTIGLMGSATGSNSSSAGVAGTHTGTGNGVYGSAVGGIGVLGIDSSGIGVNGRGTTGRGGYFQTTTGVPLAGADFTAATNTVTTLLQLLRSTSGTAAAGIGGALDFSIETEDETSTTYTSARIISTWTIADLTTRTGDLQFWTTNSASFTQKLNISGTGIFTITQGLQNFVDDAAAAIGGIPVTGLYRNGSIVMIRVS